MKRTTNFKIRLLVTKGNDEGIIYETDKFPFIIGRSKDADFVLEKDSNISRNHAKIFMEADKVWIEDLKSTNGSIVNNIKISEKTELSSGSSIILGNTWLKYIVFEDDEQIIHKKIDQSEDSTYYTESRKEEAILVLDQYRSSRVTDRYGDDAGMKLTEGLKKIALPLFYKHDVQFVKGTGDGFLTTFNDIHNCLASAFEILSKTEQINREQEEPDKIHIRISLHYGQSLIEPNGDRHGKAITVAFRVDGLKYRDMKKTKNSISSKELPDKNRIFSTTDFYNKLDVFKKDKFQLIGCFRLKGIKGTYDIYHMYK
ncbi:hypothetical protein ES703_111284 [subsurface metagenome]